MSPRRWGPAYWTSGGEVVGRRGPLTIPRALELLDFFETEAGAARSRDDEAASWFCLTVAVDLARAIIGAKTWRRANSLRSEDSSSRKR